MKLTASQQKKRIQRQNRLPLSRNLNCRENRDKRGNISQLPDCFFLNHLNNGAATTRIHSHHPEESADVSGGLQNFPA